MARRRPVIVAVRLTPDESADWRTKAAPAGVPLSALIRRARASRCCAGTPAEGKAKQAKGNAIERLGKNVIGFRTAMITEGIFPFICFGDGCDFADDSSILDRVTTIAMFGRLNRIHLHVDGLPQARFDRGSFFFRHAAWTAEEMRGPMLQVAEGAVYYYFSKYGDGSFTG